MRKLRRKPPILASAVSFAILLTVAYVFCRYILGIGTADGLLVATTFAGAMAGVIAAVLIAASSKADDATDAPDRLRGLDAFSSELSAIIERENQALERLLTKSGRLPVSWKVLSSSSRIALDLEPQPLPNWPNELERLLRGLRQRQLVILGEPGSGKTVMAVSLLLRLISSAAESDPVPVRFSVSSWNPRVETLHGWIWRTLLRDYPEIEQVLTKYNLIGLRHLIVRQRILPILDGFDEIQGGDLRSAALESIRQEQGVDLPMVITSRTAEYAAFGRNYGALPGATVVEMHPLYSDQALKYLLDNVEQDERSLTQAMPSGAGLDADLMTTLTSPLMIWLAGVALVSGHVRLGDLFGDNSSYRQAALRQRLLSALVPGAFSVALRRPLREDELASRSDPRQAEEWLAFLARRLLARGRKEIIWWQLYYLVPRRALALIGAGLIGTLIGLAAGGSALLEVEVDMATLMGVLLGFSFSNAYSAARLRSVSLRGRMAYGGRAVNADPDLFILSRKLLFGFIAVTVLAVFAGIATFALRFSGLRIALFLHPDRYLALVEYTCAGMLLALFLGFVGGKTAGVILRSMNSLDMRLAGARATTPAVAVRKDRGSALGMFAIGTLVCGVLTSAMLWLATGYLYWSAGLAAVAGGIIASMIFAHWPTFRLSTIWFAVRDQLPFDLINFLEEAHQAGILRQMGNSYEFRHDLLQESLAETAHSDS